ncbi:MAG: protein-export chaperone SecB, partial [Pseudomonadota bacterium]|nr:protein-export chaperone SecB [Pseudomonadota bacterium]
MSNQQQPVFGIEKIYVKDLSLEIPNAPRIFLERETPVVNIQLHTKGERIDEGMFEVL